MTARTTARKTTASKANAAVLKDLSKQLLTPAQYQAVTTANYYHPDSRIVLHLFLYVNYVWQIARKLQNDPSLVSTFDWATIEKNSGKLVNDSLSKLLTGIDRTPWTGAAPAPEPVSKPARKTKAAPRLACGCKYHSYAAGVVEACQLGQEQGADECWTGF